MSLHVGPHRWIPALVAACTITVPAAAQQRRLTAADYARAERAMVNPRVATLEAVGQVTPNWLPDDRFWYRTPDGDFLLVNPAKHTRGAAFDQAKVAAALSTATGRRVDAQHLPFRSISFTKDRKSIMVTDSGKEWSCDVKGSRCTVLLPGTIPHPVAPAGGFGGGRGGFARGPMSSHGEPLNVAPDGKRGVFIHDWNLWVKDLTTGHEKQLTTDGVKDFGYATNNAGWIDGPNAIVLWSADSRMIATQQQDQRNDGDMYLVTTPTGREGTQVFSERVAGHPVLRAWKYPLPGDSIVTMIQRVVINVDNGKMVRFEMPPDQHRSIQGDELSMNDVKWSPDDSKVVFASVVRDHKRVWVREADAATGAVHTLFEETSPTHVESWAGWQVLWHSNEILWYSQRDNWGQLYRYDLATGKLKNQVTTGDGNVTRVVRVNDTTGMIWFDAVGREKGLNPYFTHFYRVNLDGTHLVSLTPDEGNHAVASSADGRYLVDTWTTTSMPPASAVRDGRTGALIMPLDKADPAKLYAANWHPPTLITMKARDGTTDIYGLMFTPTNLDSTKKYPIINHIYPGPQAGSVGGGFGYRAAGGEPQGLAELGFVVVEINGMGTPNRDKKFMDAYYAHMGDNTLPDQVAGMKELAQRYRFIDIDKAGIYGHSGGGFAAADAMFRYPDFFKVGISESGNHDNREYEDDWGERYQGLETRNPDGTDNYTAEANETFAKNLKGHLLLAHGTMDNNVPPYNTLLVVDQLIKANKDFDLLLLPNNQHGYTAGQYMQRRRWDYFVRYLMGAEPPKEYRMGMQGGGRGGQRGPGGPGT